MIGVKLIVYEEDEKIFEGIKFVKDKVTEKDFRRLVEYEGELAYFFRRMRNEPMRHKLEVEVEEEEGRKVVKGYFR